jgi:simple sugar transport system permease protein
VNRSRRLGLASFLAVLAIILASFAIAVGLIFVFSKNPGQTLYYYFLGPFLNRYAFFNMLESAIPLVFAGLGIALAFNSGVTNLGGEGQIFSGALAAVIIGIAVPAAPRAVGILAILAGGALCGALLAGFSGMLRRRWNVSELLTTYLLSSGVVYVINYLILGPLRNPQKMTIESVTIPARFMLARLAPPSFLHSGALLALAGAAAVYFLIYRTHLGYELRAFGSNRQFARYGGIDVGHYFVLPLLISGGLTGLGGAVQVVGRYQSCFTDLTAGLGWNGIAVALIARNNPLAVVPAALLFAYLSAGAKSAMINSDVTFELAAIIQSVIFYLITAEAALAFFRRRLSA